MGESARDTISTDRGLSKAVAALLREDPPGWEMAAYRVRHKSGLSVWIGNGAAQLSLVHPQRGEMWGLTMWMFLGGSPAQRRVWRAFKTWQRSGFVPLGSTRGVS